MPLPHPLFFFLNFFIEKLRQLTHVVGTLSHKGIARRALPASGVKGVEGGGRIEKKIKVNDTHAFSMKRSSGASKVPFPSPRVQSLQRPSKLVSYVTPDWSFSSGVRNLFVFRA